MEPTDDDVRQALREAEWDELTPENFREALEGSSTLPWVIAHARTIAKLRIAREALERVLERGYVSQFIEEERPDHEMIATALAATEAHDA